MAAERPVGHCAEQVAVDAELALSGGAVADHHGRAVLVAGRGGGADLIGYAPVEGVEDAHVRAVVGDRVQQPGDGGVYLFLQAEHGQRVDGEGGVADPAEAVVPVLVAADALRQ